MTDASFDTPPWAQPVRVTVRRGPVRHVHLWTAAVPSARRLTSLAVDELDAEEIRRMAAFRRDEDRTRYAAAHLALRRLVAEHTGISAGDLRFGRDPCPGCGGPHGRPVLLNAASDLHFSLSHSHRIILICLAATPLGADIQRTPTPSTTQACLSALHPLERRELEALHVDERPGAFGLLWTRKEAYLKVIGIGLARGAGKDYLGGIARARASGWDVENVAIEPGYAAAVSLPSA